jgi:sulfur carrier protein ThiS adenylyltransferase
MNVYVNEQSTETPPGTTLFGLRDQMKPDADVVVLNGAPASADQPLQDGDAIVLIRRGEVPDAEELEALMAARHTPGVHEAVQRSSVGIAGLGGLGSAIAIALARIGVGRLVLADFDVVEPSNLNRQQYFVDQIGQLKTDAMQANLARIHPYVEVETHTVRLTAENVPAVFGDVDVLVEAFDKPDAKAMIMEVCATAMPDTPLVMASGLAGHAPSNTIQSRQLGRQVTLVGDLVEAAGPGKGLMAPRVGVAAHHQANAVLRILLGEDPVGDSP